MLPDVALALQRCSLLPIAYSMPELPAEAATFLLVPFHNGEAAIDSFDMSAEIAFF